MPHTTQRIANQMSVAEIVRLKEIGTPDDAVLQLIGVTCSVFSLSRRDVLELRDQGVSAEVINAMQKRR